MVAHVWLLCAVQQLLLVLRLIQLRLLHQHQRRTRQLLLALQEVNKCAVCACVLS
jgi:hypothetical protein